MLMSCRVVGRGIEDAFLAAIARRAEEEDASDIEVTFEQSEKNELARIFVERLFKNTLYAPVSQFKTPDWITVI